MEKVNDVDLNDKEKVRKWVKIRFSEKDISMRGRLAQRGARKAGISFKDFCLRLKNNGTRGETRIMGAYFLFREEDLERER